MATYTELYGLVNNGDLRLKVLTAMVIAANQIRVEVDTTTNHANRVIWAKQVLERPLNKLSETINLVLAANKDATEAAILSATDSSIQTAVDNVIDFLADGT